jgi:hypothetical protein
MMPRESSTIIRLTPIYSTCRAVVANDYAWTMAAEFSLPIGRKELASTWWKNCPSKCRAHLPQIKSKDVCKRNCAVVRRQVVTLSKRMLDAGDDNNKLSVQSTCRYPNLIHLEQIVQPSKHDSVVYYDVLIGLDAKNPWMRFLVHIAPLTSRTVTTPRSTVPKAVSARVTDDTVRNMTRKRRREDGSWSENDSLDSNSSKRALFSGVDRSDCTLNLRPANPNGDIKQRCVVEKDAVALHRRKTDRLMGMKELCSDDEDSLHSSGSAQRSLFHEEDRFATQLRSLIGKPLAREHSNTVHNESDSTILISNQQRPLHSNAKKPAAITPGREVDADAKACNKPAPCHRVNIDAWRTPMSTRTSDNMTTSQQLCVLQKQNARDIASRASDAGMALESVPGDRSADSGCIPSLSFLSMPECQSQASGDTDATDSMYEATQAEQRQRRNDDKDTGPIERMADTLSVEDWKDLQRKEKAADKSSHSLFRSALIDLIVAKQDTKKSDRGGMSPWLPPLFDSETVVQL